MPRRQASRQRVSRDVVVAAALEIIESDGVAALTMRALAGRLGISAPTLYWHFESRSELLAAVGATLLAELPDAQQLGDDWRRSVRATLLALWDVAERHPAFLDVVGVRPLHAPEGMQLLSGVLATLRHAGFEPEEAVRLGRSFLWLAFGLIRGAEATAAREPGSDVALLVDAANPNAHVVVECAPYLRHLDPADVYRTTIDLALAGAPDPGRR